MIDSPRSEEGGNGLPRPGGSEGRHPSELERARILIVDDEPANLRLLEQLMARSGYRYVASTRDPREVLSLYASFRPDLLLLDLQMPHLDGFAVMKQISAATPPEEFFPILVLTADLTEETRVRALSAGANDFLTKPFSFSETLLRIRNLLQARSLHLHMEQRVRERTAELDAARLEVVERLAQAVEFRDDCTGRHTRRVGESSAALAATLGLADSRVELIRRAAPLHDAGKVAIPDTILQKPGRLTPEEFDVMKTHTSLGARILAGGRSELMRTAERIALSHHERWDGGGYPQGLAGEEIPLEARIVAVADVFDALTHPRSYRGAWTMDDALDEIQRGAGSHFDPRVADAFVRAVSTGAPAARGGEPEDSAAAPLRS